MDAFKTHEQVISNYRSYLSSFLNIADERIKEEVKRAFDSDGFIPEPLIQFNPSFEKGNSLNDLPVNAALSKAFGAYNLYKHQYEAIQIGIQNKGFVVTFGSEHNSPAMEPIELFARHSTPLSEKLMKINYEGACVTAAHQHLTTQGLNGYVDEKGVADRSKRDEFVKLGDQLIKSIIER